MWDTYYIIKETHTAKIRVDTTVVVTEIPYVLNFSFGIYVDL